MCKHCNGETCVNSEEQVTLGIDQEEIDDVEEVGANFVVESDCDIFNDESAIDPEASQSELYEFYRTNNE